MAYRVTSESGHGVLVGASQRHRHCSLTRNAALAGTTLSCISLVAAVVALFGHGGSLGPSHGRPGRSALPRIAWIDPAPPKIVPRNPMVAIVTPGPHLARIAVTTIPLPRARPAQTATLAPEPTVDEMPVPVDEPAKIASSPPLVPLPAARPTKIASITPATVVRERGDGLEITGSIGEPAHEKAARPAAPQQAPGVAGSRTIRKAAAKPDNSFFGSLFKPASNAYEKLYGPVRVASLSYADADAGGDEDSGLPHAPFDHRTAVYVIAEKKVYLPDGRVLEAHSGLGDKMDDPRFVNVRMRGATPPHMYDLSLRESLFHGVEAIRLKPVGGEKRIFGRSGLLAHSYMLGPNGQSNGCVSFRDYEAFLRAYKSGEITRLAVIARLD
ncbi:MAG TPA: DUF2778 domain-containing protein [Pseudolabrys sp.]|nr:DUF2778 domain-containing protein [Pseudolabrys sp.]